MSRRVVDAVRPMPERRRFLRGMVAWAGFKQVPIEYRRAAAGRAAARPTRSCSGSASRRSPRSPTCRCRSPPTWASRRRRSARRRGRAARAGVGRRWHQRDRVDARRGAVPRRGAARRPGHHRPLSGSRARGVAAPAAVPGRSRCRALRSPRTDGARARSERFTGSIRPPVIVTSDLHAADVQDDESEATAQLLGAPHRRRARATLSPMTGPTVGLATRTERRRLVASAVPATVWMAGSVVVSLTVELIFFRPSWFFLDDIRNLAEARQRGLTWGYDLADREASNPRPPSVGRRVVAVPLGGHWGAALTLELAFCAVALSYLARTRA